MPDNTMQNAVALARDILATDAESSVFEKMNELYHAGLAAWQMDPEVENVIGFMNLQSSDRNKAWLVVYLDQRDWELSADFERMLQQPVRTYADDRCESEPCEAGTVGCSINHNADHGSCEGY